MDVDISRARELLSKREELANELSEIDAELGGIFSGNGSGKSKSKRAPQKCSKCGEEGHSARTCPNPEQTQQQ